MPLDEVYVKTRFSQGAEVLTDVQLTAKFAAGQRVVVKGNGGSGKTIFLKHLWLSRFQQPEGRIPIFVELRRLNDLKSIDILAFCRNELQSDMSFGKGVFEKLCEAGKFEFIFDGFDEVNRESRKTVERQLISISEKYRKCCFLISGREDDRFSSWGEFEIYSVSPLSLEDVRELIEKIPFDRKVKKKFLETLKEDFYRQHKSFLSSPLLACMMLMTFNENATIPSKLTEFYKSAFQTLLTWHDATKDSFERDRSLSVDEFRRVFSTFCLVSYYDQAFEFDDETFRRYMQKSLDYHGIEANLDDVINDVCESANLLQKDGLKYLFVHRSFQEYFAAECAMQVVSGKASEFLKVFAKRLRDTVFAMCYELHPELVFDKYFSERFDWIRDVDFLNDVKGGMRQENPWICSSITAECRHLKGDLLVTDIRVEIDDERREALQVISLCGRVRDTNLLDPADLALHSVFQSVKAVSKDGILSQLDGASLRIKLSFVGGGHKLSVRNSGELKFPTTETKKFRPKIVSALSDNLKRNRKLVNEYYRCARDMIVSLEKERQTKEKSIDDILGI
ncbi:NACHT domain-containing protein [Sulfitobacter aestuarii]